MLKNFTLSLVLAGAMMALAAEAQATPITGGISFSGLGATPTGGSDWSTATGVDFAGLAIAGSGTGSYAGVIALATFNDFTYDPGLSPSPVLLWTFTDFPRIYSFDLGSLTSVVKAGSAASSSVAVNGLGTLHITGYEDTAGTFVFTGNSSNGSFSFSASDGASASVPEPTSVFLLGTGLLGIVVLVQRRTKRQNEQL